MINGRINLNKEGLELSRIVAGVWKWGKWGANLSIDREAELIQASYDYGITSFDHADIYGDYLEEIRFGKALKKTNITRDNIEIITKCGIKLISDNRPENIFHSYNTSINHVVLSAEKSLEYFDTDYIDLLLIHRPSPLMDIHAIAEAFTALEKDGKVRFFGVSNFSPAQFETLNALYPLVTNQIEASLLHLEPFKDNTLLQCQHMGIHPMAWSPLGSGKLLTAPETEQEKRIELVCKKLCEKYNCEKSQILLAFLLKHPSGIIPVLGTSKKQRLEASLEALKIELSHEEWFELWVASTGKAVP